MRLHQKTVDMPDENLKSSTLPADLPLVLPKSQRRQPAPLVRARQNGYLDARRAGARRLLAPYALWCWQFKLPLVWLEKRSPSSRYTRLRLDLFTTPEMLSARGMSALTALEPHPTAVSPHDAVWDRVRHGQVRTLAHAVMRAALRPENRAGNRGHRQTKLLRLEAA